MNPTPAQTSVPTPSAIAAYLPGAYFHDAWGITPGEPGLSALGQFLKALQATPPWVNTLIANTADEVLLGDRDKHLDVVLSVHQAAQANSARVRVTVTTVVHVHNWFGVLYMLPVTPMHRLISKTVLKAVGRAPKAV